MAQEFPITFIGDLPLMGGGGGGYDPGKIKKTLAAKSTWSRAKNGILVFGLVIFGKRHAQMNEIFSDRIKFDALDDRTENLLELYVVCDKRVKREFIAVSPLSFTEWRAVKREFEIEERENPVLMFYNVKNGEITERFLIEFTQRDTQSLYVQLQECITTVVQSLGDVLRDGSIDYDSVFDIHVVKTINGIKFVEVASKVVSQLPIGKAASWLFSKAKAGG
jgi:hypothetical protein